MSNLSGKTALVTGASRGIGRASALGLAKAGAQVLVHYNERSVLRVKNFFADLNERLGQVPLHRRRVLFRCGHHRLGDSGFRQALELSVPAEHAALKRWYETVSSRPSAAA
jgi:NAD(P)-dependent dehydrogenase (short-subunit alcohol dehydrogenase family)